MISNELLEEVISESKKKRFISKGLLMRVAISVIENSNPKTKQKFQEIKYVKFDNEYALASCYRDLGIIEIDYEKIIESKKEYTDVSYLTANFLIIQTVMHEVEHLNEDYKISQKGFKAQLLRINSQDFLDKMWKDKSKKFNSIKKRKKYIEEKELEYSTKYWDIFPAEKIAEAESFELLLKVLDQYPGFKKNYKKEYLFILKEYIDRLNQGYTYNSEMEKYNVPLRDYLKFINYYVKYENLKLVLQKSNETKSLKTTFSVEERMKYGLPITKEDVKQLTSKILVLKSTK